MAGTHFYCCAVSALCLIFHCDDEKHRANQPHTSLQALRRLDARYLTDNIAYSITIKVKSSSSWTAQLPRHLTLQISTRKRATTATECDHFDIAALVALRVAAGIAI